MSTENIEQFLHHSSQGNKEEAFTAFNAAVMDKISDRLDDMKVQIAQKQFGFSNEGKEPHKSYNDKKRDEEKKDNPMGNKRKRGEPMSLARAKRFNNEKGE